MKVLRKDLLDRIQREGSLLELVAKLKGVAMFTVLRQLEATDRVLLNINSLNKIAAHLKCNVEDIIEDVEEEQKVA